MIIRLHRFDLDLATVREIQNALAFLAIFTVVMFCAWVISRPEKANKDS